MNQLMIGQYPLAPLNLAAKPVMESYLGKLNLDASDYTFAANYLWVAAETGFYSIIDDCFCLFSLSNGEISMVLPPLGNSSKVLGAMRTCFALMASSNCYPASSRIEYMDETLVNSFVGHLDPDTDITDPLADYIVERAFVDNVYLAKELVELSGEAYASKKVQINKFIRSYPDHEIKPLDAFEHYDGIMALIHQWINDRMRYMPREKMETFLEGIYSERIAVKRMLRDYDQLNLIGVVILINGEVKGFTVGERINQATASVIIEKTDFNTFGCTQFLFRELVTHFYRDHGITHINVGEDMGFENLRKVKLSYKPNLLLAKYTVYAR
ncbi:DUF2156 domain-containing protein [Salinibius halmophilus]|uniref:DUF2156 domain-containing protein n=1 Tax=Salinibius halmophilus TaxID=1853216 RepID=UPI000E673B10|nr:phosphatidylglycerol lysyltransferase domain-containing protein [Salinibius halmophilus]